MPRERCHWAVLEHSIRKLDAASPVKVAVSQAREISMLGALVHDAPYYYRFGGHPIEEFSSILHGEAGQDTLAPIWKLAQNIPRTDPNAETFVAILAGMISHLATDVVFHPLVFFLTGDYHSAHPELRSRARIEHRIFEVYLDSLFLSERPLGQEFALKTLSKKQQWVFKSYLDQFIQPELQLARKHPEIVMPSLSAAFYYLEFCQRLSQSWIAAKLARSLSPISKTAREADSIAGLGRQLKSTAWELPIEYLNPVSGLARSTTLKTLFDSATAYCTELFAVLDQIITKESRLTELPVGPSLNFGEPYAPANQAKFFLRANQRNPYYN